MIQSIQKIIKIGTSGGVTIPAKELKRQNIAFGDEVKVTIEVNKTQSSHQKVMEEYNEFVKQYGKVLENLSKR
jgi:antitoxin component of MazEF toxin-antitoxin module